ncbi:MAG TPA: putative quinol monooxygenase [Candidatus Binataceae bacterium]|nr:putative quinol monooxygenase [Candidatus Binataceae bacterium]
MPLTVIAKLKVKPGSEKQIEQACTEMAANVRQEPDTLTYIMHRSTTDPTVIMVYEVYKDAAAFEYHRKTPHMAAMFSKIKDLVAGPPEVETLVEFARK